MNQKKLKINNMKISQIKSMTTKELAKAIQSKKWVNEQKVMAAKREISKRAKFITFGRDVENEIRRKTA